MQIGSINDDERRIRDVFVKHWNRHADLLDSAIQASEHGESSPDFAEEYQRYRELVASNSVQGLARFVQATIPAVVATVQELCPNE